MIICATGHRPHLLNNDFQRAKKALNSFLKMQPQISYAITGMAAGWDTIFALGCLHYRIPLHCYIPYKGQKPTTSDYDTIVSSAINIVICSEEYKSDVFLERDRQMVDAADLVCACWNPQIEGGGTYWTVCYAKKKQVPILNFLV